MSKHTPTPWRVKEFQKHSSDLESIGRIVAENGNKVADCRYYTNSSVKSEEQAIADATLIVKAVNNHERLLSILKKCLKVSSVDSVRLHTEILEAIKECES